MKDTAKKALKTGYGLGLLSLVQAKKAAEMMKRELKLDDKQSVKLAKELVKTSRKASEDVLKAVSKHVEMAVVRTGVANKRELKVVKKVVKSRVKRLRSGKKESTLSKVKRKLGRRK